MASIGEIEAAVAEREQARVAAAERFAAAKAQFSNDAEGDDEGDDEGDEPSDDEGDEPEAEAVEVEAATKDDEDDEPSSDESDDDDKKEKPVVTASVDHTKSQTIKASSVAKKVASRTKRPAVKAEPKTVITAGADIPNVPTGSTLADMDAVGKALIARAKGFSPFNAQSGKAAFQQSGGVPVLHKHGVASFGIEFPETMVAGGASNDYAAVRNAINERNKSIEASLAGGQGALTAGGWCAPSENVYSFVADYKIDGLITVPEVSAPRGGLNVTTGPQRSSQGAALDDFGFVQTEAQAIARQEKTCEVIECPEFEDHRLDAIGYCFKIPILTQKAYPEIVTDALRFANVLYAHKVNARIINDIDDMAVDAGYLGLGASFTDTLEALTIVAAKERRRWNIGVNAVLEVKVPEWVREVFRADMSRRTGLALSDVATDQRIDAEFAARHLAVEYVADYQELEGEDATFNPEFQVLMYPAGTVVKAVEDVINLSAVYDAASLSINEYTGVFFEQGIMTFRAGYGVTRLTIPVKVGGNTGAANLVDSRTYGSI